jgi:hypothetical protein
MGLAILKKDRVFKKKDPTSSLHTTMAKVNAGGN